MLPMLMVLTGVPESLVNAHVAFPLAVGVAAWPGKPLAPTWASTVAPTALAATIAPDPVAATTPNPMRSLLHLSMIVVLPLIRLPFGDYRGLRPPGRQTYRKIMYMPMPNSTQSPSWYELSRSHSCGSES